MNKKSRVVAGITTGVVGGTALGIILRKLFKRKPKITKRGEQLASAIDEKMKDDKIVLEQTKQLLEEELEKVNANLKKLE